MTPDPEAVRLHTPLPRGLRPGRRLLHPHAFSVGGAHHAPGGARLRQGRMLRDRAPRADKGRTEGQGQEGQPGEL